MGPRWFPPAFSFALLSVGQRKSWQKEIALRRKRFFWDSVKNVAAMVSTNLFFRSPFSRAKMLEQSSAPTALESLTKRNCAAPEKGEMGPRGFEPRSPPPEGGIIPSYTTAPSKINRRCQAVCSLFLGKKPEMLKKLSPVNFLQEEYLNNLTKIKSPS